MQRNLSLFMYHWAVPLFLYVSALLPVNLFLYLISQFPAPVCMSVSVCLPVRCSVSLCPSLSSHASSLASLCSLILLFISFCSSIISSYPFPSLACLSLLTPILLLFSVWLFMRHSHLSPSPRFRSYTYLSAYLSAFLPARPPIFPALVNYQFKGESRTLIACLCYMEVQQKVCLHRPEHQRLSLAVQVAS